MTTTEQHLQDIAFIQWVTTVQDEIQQNYENYKQKKYLFPLSTPPNLPENKQ